MQKIICVICLVALAFVLIGAGGEHHAAISRPAPMKTVYVDLDRLEMLHPAWDQLVQMREARGQLLKAGDINSEIATGPEFSRINRARIESDVDRSTLRQQLATNAEAQVNVVKDRLAASKQERIDQQVKELNSQLAEEVSKHQREVDADESASLRTMQEGWKQDRLNEQIQAIAARSRTKSVMADVINADSKASEAEKLLALHDEQRALEERKVESSAKNDISAFEASRREEIARQIKQLELKESNQLASEVSDYRRHLMKVVGGDNTKDNQVRNTATVAATSVTISESIRQEIKDGRSAKSGAALMSNTERRLAKKIREDTIQSIERAAAGRNLRVMFVKSTGLGDYTSYFSKLISDPSELGGALSERG